MPFTNSFEGARKQDGKTGVLHLRKLDEYCCDASVREGEGQSLEVDPNHLLGLCRLLRKQPW